MQDEMPSPVVRCGSPVNGQDACSLGVPPHCSSTEANATKPRGRKRVRRIQVELAFFRDQARELELKLKRLKLQSKSSTVKPGLPSPPSVQNLVQNRSGVDQISVWNGTAERQFKERLRVERQQQQLKQTHAELLDVSLELQKLLRKCDEQQVTSATLIWTLSACN
ncbi:unnamed protein product [Phytophthora fragariaefolia]|uniref:Unnamed protein product n=1 Tax=Phytophthora fragariaefolia TaxID=1490495 RepID=A0A9W7CPV3_9STRA|nr:unnamed protein product [Phytophthora fragariaefolia]